MASFRFYLLNAKKGGKLVKKELSIYLVININGERLWLKTQERITPQHWNFEAGEVKGSFKRGGPQINNKLLEIKKEAADYFRDNSDKMTLEQMEVNLKAIAGGKVQEVDKSFYPSFKRFMEERALTHAHNTIRKYTSTYNRLKGMFPTLSFTDVNPGFGDKLRQRMVKEGKLNDTIAKEMAVLKAFMKWAQHERLHDNPDYAQIETKPSPKVENITLSESELNLLAKAELNDRLRRVADLFLIGTYTLQRYGDVQRFRRQQLKGNVWDFTPEKTSTRLRVPLLGFSAPALELLQKYDYQPPQISNQKFNDYIKEACQAAKINSPVIISRKSGRKVVEETGEKWEFVSSHTARRSGITILLEKGVPPTTVMQLSGHTDLRTLMKYENTQEKALMEALERLTREQANVHLRYDIKKAEEAGIKTHPMMDMINMRYEPVNAKAEVKTNSWLFEVPEVIEPLPEYLEIINI